MKNFGMILAISMQPPEELLKTLTSGYGIIIVILWIEYIRLIVGG